MDIEQLSQIIGDKWQIKIIYYCGYEGMGFNELQEKLQISRSVLTRKLNNLVVLDILQKKSLTTKYENKKLYVVSSYGFEFHSVIRALITKL